MTLLSVLPAAPHIDVAPQPSTAPVPVTIAEGDGIGPEIMGAVLRILEAGGARLAVERIAIGQSIYRAGHATGVAPQAWDSLGRTRVLLKAPVCTPQGNGFKSLNVTLRKSLGLFANVRPCAAYAPFVASRHPGMDVVIVRENEEDLYAGIEHRQTGEVYQCLKLMSRPGCERIVRYAFAFARANGRAKVTCFTKDNIMKMTDGLFHAVYDEIGAEYPDIAKEHCIVDIGAAKLADAPGQFDVIVTPNLYGDILSDVAAQIAGSVGLAGSANIGEHGAMFEAIHGSAPRRAGQDVANPSGLLVAGVMMLVHIGQTRAAERIHNAWLKTIEDGIHTCDMMLPGSSTTKVGTRAFADGVIARLGEEPGTLKPVRYGPDGVPISIPAYRRKPAATKTLLGIDVFVEWHGTDTAALASRMQAAGQPAIELSMIANRGAHVWPQGLPQTFLTDHWRCRFLSKDAGGLDAMALAMLLAGLAGQGVDVVKTGNLYAYDGKPGFSLGHGP